MSSKAKKAAKKRKAEDPAFNPNMVPVPVPEDADHPAAGSSKRQRKNIFDDEDGGEGDGPAYPSASLSVNELFAQQYEEKKRAEEARRLEEKYGKTLLEESDDDESEVEEDEDGELVTAEVDAQIMRTIGLIRARKPEVYDPTVNFFDEKEMEEAKARWDEKRKALKAVPKPVTLRDQQRERILAKMKAEVDGDDGSDEEENDDDAPEPPKPTLVEEQEQLREEFRRALGGDEGEEDEDDGFLSKRERTKEEADEDEEEYKNFLLENMAVDGVQGIKEVKALRKQGGGEVAEDVDPNEKFLMEYILNKGWVEKEDKKLPSYDEIVREEHIDEEKDDEMDAFEKTYNFRFEEEGGDAITTYPRDLPNALRRKDTRRSDARAAVKERKAEEKVRQAEELKRLKNLKKDELARRILRVSEVAGVDRKMMEGLDLEGEFDPDAFDRMMKEKFDEEYYAMGDDGVKPEFEDDVGGDEDMEGEDEALLSGVEGEEDEAVAGVFGDEEEFDIDGLVVGAPRTGIGKVRVKERLEDHPAPQDGEDNIVEADAEAPAEEDFLMDADYLPGGSKYGEEPPEKEGRKKKKGRKEKRKALQQQKKGKMSLEEYLDEVYQLDYEDMIGDLPTRFKYRQVPADTFGLTPAEILLAPDSSLNRLVGLKQIAPYRSEHLRARDAERLKQVRKKRVYDVRRAIKEAEEEERKRKEEEEGAKE
ncbi:hypothetical protein HK101_010641, partial [Irineochytrium annulatum]